MSHAPEHGGPGLPLAGLLRVLADREDKADAEDADAAWDEPGDPVPLAELVAELG